MTHAQWQLVHDAICAAQDGGADEAYAAWLAVLDAIAEPSEAMTRAGNQYTNCGGSCGNRAGKETWRAMIAELRKEIE